MIQYYDLSNECSDSITNEVLKKNISNINKQIVYTAVNLGLDVFIIIVSVIALTYEKFYEFFKYDLPCYNCDCVCPCKKKYKYTVSISKQKNNNDICINRKPKNLDAPEGPNPYEEMNANPNLQNPIPLFNKPVENDPPNIFEDQGVPNPAPYPSLEEINNQKTKQ